MLSLPEGTSSPAPRCRCQGQPGRRQSSSEHAGINADIIAEGEKLNSREDADKE
jgi:hypothetical protein